MWCLFLGEEGYLLIIAVCIQGGVGGEGSLDAKFRWMIVLFLYASWTEVCITLYMHTNMFLYKYKMVS